MRSVPADLALYLRRARAEGRPFIDAWIDGLQRTTTGRRDSRVWMEVLSGTHTSWRRAYEQVPQTGAEAAAAVLAASAFGDIEQLPIVRVSAAPLTSMRWASRCEPLLLPQVSR